MIHANDNGKPITFISMFSGIEAASVAFGPLGWRAVCFAEIEKFPSAVLAHHYPDVPNVGDMSKHDWAQYRGKVDIVCGGPPCQDFSIAGLRAGLDGERGNLSIVYMRALHAIKPRNAIVENVPGWLNDKKNAFGCFLAGLVGADDPLRTPNGKSWPNAGMVAGPLGRAAWRVLDAQYFGLAQRRRRVIVVADFGNGADPAAVLFEQDGVRRHTPPSREAGKDIAPTISARTKGGGGLGTDFDLDGGLIQHAVSVAPCLRAGGNATGGDRPYGTDADTAVSLVAYVPEIARCDATREGSSQDYETTTMVAHAIQAGALRTNPNSGPDGVGVQEGVAYTLEARSEVQAVCVTGEVTHTLKAEGADASEDGTGRGTPIVCIHADSIGRTGEAITPSADATGLVRLRNPGMGINDDGTSYNLMASGQPHAVAFVQNSRDEVRLMAGDGQIVGALAAEPGAKQQCYLAQSVAIRGREGGAIAELGGEVATALRASQGGGDKPHVLTSAVRRLTPIECERLQGFPDGYTAIPWRGKPADQCPDGPRYKALGNSWAVPKFVWLGKRLQRLLAAQPAEIKEAA